MSVLLALKIENDIVKKDMSRLLESYCKDHKRAMERSERVDRSSAKREQERIADYHKLSYFGRV